ncbi:hypothetical protein Poli38472_003951 [Pythium oligandrum]|uniref:Uncharacterized protein n=1 Tax=Pythium oligandrum TaxID=41045 RepID=A0A8K1CM62_PYTOL|nr:hypothetical protein Poli38472_003951 [Pythium oligandrum]|eukprot:TMW66186.1 hypothetical protein Poli38472_003951 [Pythium oligandrum]
MTRRRLAGVLTATLGIWLAKCVAHVLGGTVASPEWSILSKETEELRWDDAESEVVRCALDELHARLTMELPEDLVLQYQDTDEEISYVSSLEGSMELIQIEEAGENVMSTTRFDLKRMSTPSRTRGRSRSKHPSVDSHGMHPNQRLECEFDPEFCVPKLVGIRLPDVIDQHDTLDTGHAIVVQFAEPTNRPVASTREDIERFIHFPVYVGDELSGKWADSKTLEIRVQAIEREKVSPLRELMQGLVQTTLQPLDTVVTNGNSHVTEVYRGEARYRIDPTGVYLLRATINSVNAGLRFVATSPSLRVRSCHPATVIISSDAVKLKDVALSKTFVKLPTPKFFMEGVTSHSGDQSFVLQHSAIDMAKPGSWSMNFWLFTVENATGDFRTLFFNGDGTGQHRTPSAWFRPSDEGLVLRASTVENMDTGLDSSMEIPVMVWTNIGFTFVNCSEGARPNSSIDAVCSNELIQDDSSYYAMKFFVNGELENIAKFHAPVLPNTGPLYIAKGPWTDGMKGFISNLRIFGTTVSEGDHHGIYVQEKISHINFDNDTACDGFEQYKGDRIEVTQQIAYIMQCPLQFKGHQEESAKTTTQQIATVPSGSGESMYSDAMALQESCDTHTWDLLRESADLGHPKAMHAVGTALLYGSLEYPESCSSRGLKSFPLKIDHGASLGYVSSALRHRQWGAAQSLALLSEISPELIRDETIARLKLGLYHVAAAGGQMNAYAVLGRMYAAGDGAKVSLHVSAFHYLHAAVSASAAYHARGKQPLHEMNRLYDGVKEDLSKGQLGDDDELIQYQKMRADKDGDVDAMANMGDLYYWGARGLTRDHEQAYRYFQRAAEAGHTSSQSAVAGMLLKGEGTDQDNATAIKWYEKASLKNHTRALNGLGFIHFYGSGGVVENKTRALELFERAAANQEDGDSIFNTGYCYAFGLGTPVNVSRAMYYYDQAARKFGHFDSIFELGKIYMNGVEGVVTRDSQLAITYLKAASDVGQWGRRVRQGFDLFLAGDYERAAILYHDAQEHGYAIATSNLAYLYDQKLLQEGDILTEQRALAYLLRTSQVNGDKEVLVRIGDYHFYGLAGLTRNPKEAMRWYSRASTEGAEAGAYNVGHMYEYGLGVEINHDRAERYYRRVLELSSNSIENIIAVHLAIRRLRLRGWLAESPFSEWLMNSSSHAGSNITLPGSTRETGASVFSPGENWSFTTQTSLWLTIALLSIGTWFIRRARS